MKIDLQIHTNHSDGRDTPSEVIELAKQGGLNVISITDHDLVSGVAITATEGQKHGIKVIPGIEISTGYRGQPLHVLGYGIDVNNAELKTFLDKVNEYRKNHFISMVPQINMNLSEKGKKGINIDAYSNKTPNYYSIPGVALFLFEEGIVSERNEGFGFLSGVCDVAPDIEPKEAFEIIRNAGGKAFLSHPFAPLISLKNVSEDKEEQERIVLEFKEQGLSGLECYQTGHSKEDVEFCLELSRKHDLLISAGSDWHGCLEKTGHTIKNWLPFYLEKLGDLEVPEDKVQEILKGLGVNL